MPSRTNSRTSLTSKKDVRAPKELQICRESGETYRPFIDPSRIETNDARRAGTCDARARTKGVPDAFLGILSPMGEASLPRQKASGSHQPCGNVSGHGQQRVLSLDVPNMYASAHNTNPGASRGAATSARAPTPILTPPGAYHDKNLYPSGRPGPFAPFDFGHQYLARMPPPVSSSSSTASGNADVTALDLDDPALFAEALEIVRSMRLEDMDLDLLRLDVEHDVMMQDRDVYFVGSTAFLDHGI